MERRWFAPKRYGWGWTPITWQGWLVVAVMVAAPLTAFIATIAISGSESLATIVTLGVTAGTTAVGIAVSYATGGKPTWRWGDRS